MLPCLKFTKSSVHFCYQAGFGDHGQDNRGAATLPLLLSDATELSRLAERVSLPPDAKVIDIKVNDVPLSSERTTNYWCVWVEMPSDAKYHVYDAEVRRGEILSLCMR
jgi:hypothetical protein